MKTILVTGANGQLGNSIRQLAAGYPQYAFVFTDVDTLDICDAQAVDAFVKEKQADYIINCAAYTAVDKAEDDEALCFRINRDAVRNLGEAARMAGARVIHGFYRLCIRRYESFALCGNGRDLSGFCLRAYETCR